MEIIEFDPSWSDYENNPELWHNLGIVDYINDKNLRLQIDTTKELEVNKDYMEKFKQYNLQNNLNYSLIKYPISFVCSPFQKVHNKKHILFAGDSFTAGDGLIVNELWSYKTYMKIKEIEDIGPFFSLGFSGGSNGFIIDSVLKYIKHYGKPDVIFLMLTENSRDKHFIKEEFIETYNKNMYFYLEQYCNATKIELYSFTWLLMPDNVVEMWSENPFEIIEKNQKNIKDFGVFPIQKTFNTFYEYSLLDMQKTVFKYDQKSKNPYSMVARDNGAHPGESFHDFYSDFIFNKYIERKNNYV